MTNDLVDFKLKEGEVQKILDMDVPSLPPEVQSDFVSVRDNIIDIIKKTSEAVDSVNQLADQSQSHHYYKVVGELIRTELEANRDLLDLHKKRKDMEASEEGPHEVHNNLIMTSADILKLIKGEPNDS